MTCIDRGNIDLICTQMCHNQQTQQARYTFLEIKKFEEPHEFMKCFVNTDSGEYIWTKALVNLNAYKQNRIKP